MTGTISVYNRLKDFGFYIPDDLTADLFVHVSNLPANHKYVNTGDRVEYSVGESRGKPLAINIHIVEENPHPVDHLAGAPR